MSATPDGQRWLLVYFPHLNLDGAATVGPWELRSSKKLRGLWPTPALSGVGRRFIRKHRTALGKPLDPMTVATRDGLAALSDPGPSAEELNALQAAVTLGVLAKNPAWTLETQHDSWRVSTSDNALLRAAWLTENMRWFGMERGSMVSTLSGGHRLDRRGNYITAPLELHQPFSNGFDSELADTAYGILLDGNPDLSGRLLTSIGWLAQVWSNSPSIVWNVRVVAVRSGIEVWLRKRGAWDQARALRTRFEDLIEQYPGTTFDTLWSPSEEAELEVVVGGKVKSATPLQHWYVALSGARNATVHNVFSSVGQVYEANTPYDGPFVWTGERVLRDLLRTEISLATGLPLVFEALGRALRKPDALQEFRALRQALVEDASNRSAACSTADRGRRDAACPPPASPGTEAPSSRGSGGPSAPAG